MDIRFQRTELVDAPPRRMFGVLTDYEAYPRINRVVTNVRVLHRDPWSASVVADRRTPIERRVRFVDAYAAPPLLQLERRYAFAPFIHAAQARTGTGAAYGPVS